jgi:hypothetical protein
MTEKKIVNFCNINDKMPVCKKACKPDEQGECSYFITATHFNRCLFLTFDEYCMSVSAKLRELENT